MTIICTHPWAKFVDDGDDVVCTMCAEHLTPAEIRQSKVDEFRRLADTLAQAQHDLMHGDSNWLPHFQAYKTAFDEYRAFRETHMTRRFEPIPV